MSTISAQPYDFPLPADVGIALIIIDMQRDFLEPGGFGDALGNDVARLQAIVPTVKRLQETFRALGLPIFQTVEGHQSDLSDCPPSKRNRGNASLKIGDPGPMGRILVLGEPGNGIIPELAPLPGELVIPKPGKGAFYNTNLEFLLKTHNISHLLIAGVTTEVCVQTTLREANDRGYECLLIEDATESYFPEFKQATLEMVRAQGGIVGWTTTADCAIAALTAHFPGALETQPVAS
jgi:biuret amidohydrolase